MPQMNRIGLLAAVCDVDRQKAECMAASSGARVYTDIDTLLENEPAASVVVVCTPNGLHAEHAIKSLQARRHVLCEKPLCLSASAAWTMRDTAHFFRRKLFVVKQNRFNPPVRFVKDLLQQNALGKILSFSINGFWSRPQPYYSGGWHGTTDQDGGILYTQFSHFIDLLLWMLGTVSDVKALQQNNGLRQNFALEDSFVALVHMQNGALGTLHFSINAYGENKEGSFTLIGEKGTVKIGGPYLNTLEWCANESGIDVGEQMTTPANNHGLYPGSRSNHHLVYDELQKALLGQPNELPQVQETVQTIELIEKMYNAARHV